MSALWDEQVAQFGKVLDKEKAVVVGDTREVKWGLKMLKNDQLMYGNVKSLYCIPEANITLYVNSLELK